MLLCLLALCPLPGLEARVLLSSATGASGVHTARLWIRKKQGGHLGARVTVKHQGLGQTQDTAEVPDC